MTFQQQRQCSKGFTLIELLVVVIILAILAAIVIPQFANSTVDAKEATLDANLAAMRSSIEQYKIQHSTYPGATVASGGTGCTGTVGTGAANTAQAFIEQMTLASNLAGQTCTVADASYRFGPYVRQTIPNEPINNKGSAAADIVVTTTAVPIAPAVTVTTGGWAYDTKSGQFVMNSGVLDSKGVKGYFTH
jgi:prepilin-type N-terminal cleavage/methylation domain-containing protein